jgi:hypothetical protein
MCARGAAAPEVARRLTFVPTAWDRVGVTDAHRTGDPDIEQAVIARYRLTGDGFGSASDWAMVREAQGVLRDAIKAADVGELDGNEFGGGEVVLYAYGPDADALYAAMAPGLRHLPLRPAQVTLRYGSASDRGVAERQVDL